MKNRLVFYVLFLFFFSSISCLEKESPKPEDTRPAPPLSKINNYPLLLKSFFNVDEEEAQTYLEHNLSLKALKGSPKKRPFWLYIPSTYSPEKNFPLLIVLHKRSRLGAYRAGQVFDHKKLQICAKQELNMWKPLAEKEGFLLAIPLGDVDILWMGISWRTGNREGLFKPLLETIKNTNPFDASRVYLTGTGEGAHAAIATAIARGNMITAVAVSNPPLFTGSSKRIQRKNVEVILPSTLPEMLATASSRKAPLWIMAGEKDQELKIRSHRHSGIKTSVRYQDSSDIPAGHISKICEDLRENGYQVAFKKIPGRHYAIFPVQELKSVWDWLKTKRISP
jgi:poly(3-hydroxybutyrate) depolymerase